ncbi:MAG: hypothetical protein KGH84_00775 [Paracoccaceae bacterium]|nr:hypothetical protein [Paracoccaceae bacterium]
MKQSAISGMSGEMGAGREGITMDYGKSGAVKTGKGTPRHKEHNAKGTEKNPFGQMPDKAALLARMKAAAEAKAKPKA